MILGCTQVMFVVAWIVGEIGGGILGFIISGGGRDAGPIALVFALMGVACGAGGVFFMASSVKARKTNYGGGGSKYGNNYGGSNNQVLFPPSLQDPYASPQYPQQQYPPPQYPPNPYQQPYPQQQYPQQPYPQQPGFAPPPPPPGFPAPAPFPQAAAPIRFSCPQGHVLEDDSSAAGQQRSCPICSTNFIVPGPAIPTAKPVAPTAVRRPPQPPQPPKR